MNLRKLSIVSCKGAATMVVVLAFHCLLHAQSPQPSARHLAHLIYDEQSKQAIVYGGSTGAHTFNDLWAYGPSGWKKLFEGGPPERTKAAFAFDVNRKKAVLFGGTGPGNRLLDDTWEWDGKAWKQIMATGPIARNHSLTTYDAKNMVVVMFGGVGPNGLLSDTWIFDGTSWKVADNTGPKDCLPHGMVYNSTTEKVILVTLSVIRDPKDESHAINSLWEWTGSSWKKYVNTTFTTSSNLQSLSSFGSDGIVLFDGSDVTDKKCKTWTFKQSSWTSQNLDGPSSRFGHAMIFDKSRGKAILFGGFSNGQLLNDLWSWDGHAWIELK